MKIHTQHRFEHSYSKEFGWGEPERRMTQYGVRIGNGTGDYDFNRIKIERHDPAGDYFVWSRRDYIDPWLPTGVFKSMQRAKRYILECWERATDEQRARYIRGY